jgi:hypothetical protein
MSYYLNQYVLVGRRFHVHLMIIKKAGVMSKSATREIVKSKDLFIREYRSEF